MKKQEEAPVLAQFLGALVAIFLLGCLMTWLLATIETSYREAKAKAIAIEQADYVRRLSEGQTPFITPSGGVVWVVHRQPVIISL